MQNLCILEFLAETFFLSWLPSIDYDAQSTEKAYVKNSRKLRFCIVSEYNNIICSCSNMLISASTAQANEVD